MPGLKNPEGSKCRSTKRLRAYRFFRRSARARAKSASVDGSGTPVRVTEKPGPPFRGASRLSSKIPSLKPSHRKAEGADGTRRVAESPMKNEPPIGTMALDDVL